LKNLNFFERAQKRSKLSENDIDIIYGAKLLTIQPKKCYEGPKLMRLHFAFLLVIKLRITVHVCTTYNIHVVYIHIILCGRETIGRS
jgi:hypothetical protein